MPSTPSTDSSFSLGKKPILHKPHSPEFRAEAVREVIDRSRSVADVARELGLVPQTLTKWVAAHRRTSAGGEEKLTVQDRARIKE
ncbi:transposase [Rathayibacter rathayi]|uniref:Transposase n=3 Tax=Rathayibacter rathayi TaxID=33887 RepID=A0ABX5A9B3_RATRA|nr:transposase [Rathayibacter rathayi]PPH27476.1 transposase [Rathayibacter rathayi]PPH70528.1 transposase [Rathayibacter rathayi]PPI74262.1 transposase [Rathayibacter rathayi]